MMVRSGRPSRVGTAVSAPGHGSEKVAWNWGFTGSALGRTWGATTIGPGLPAYRANSGLGQGPGRCDTGTRELG